MSTIIKQLDPQTSVSGQLDPADIPGLVESGVTLLVCNRPDSEDPGQPPLAAIARAAQSAGVQVVHLPFQGGMIPAEFPAELAALLTQHQRVHAYCRSGTRSTYLWALARLSQGEAPATVRAQAAAAGYDVSSITG